jgi:hypothetical protein
MDGISIFTIFVHLGLAQKILRTSLAGSIITFQPAGRSRCSKKQMIVYEYVDYDGEVRICQNDVLNKLITSRKMAIFGPVSP